MCTKHLKAIIVRALANLAELEHVDNAPSREVASMSASTTDRALKGLKRVGPGSVRKNRRSGKDDPATYFTCCPGGKGMVAHPSQAASDRNGAEADADSGSRTGNVYMQVTECFTVSVGRSRLCAARHPFGDGPCYRHSQPSTPSPTVSFLLDELGRIHRVG